MILLFVWQVVSVYPTQYRVFLPKISDEIEVSTLLLTLPLPIRSHLSRRVLLILIHFDQCCQLQISTALAVKLACNHGQSQDGRSDAIACFAQCNLVLTHLVPCIYRDVTVEDSNFMHSQVTVGKRITVQSVHAISNLYFHFIFITVQLWSKIAK